MSLTARGEAKVYHTAPLINQSFFPQSLYTVQLDQINWQTSIIVLYHVLLDIKCTFFNMLAIIDANLFKSALINFLIFWHVRSFYLSNMLLYMQLNWSSECGDFWCTGHCYDSIPMGLHVSICSQILQPCPSLILWVFLTLL